MKRRDFVKACAATAILVHQNPMALANTNGTGQLHQAVRLVDSAGNPIRPGDLEPHANYVFRYPYDCTPCFLLNLNRPTEANVPLRTESGENYVWQGGVGPNRSIVAYAAICTHRLTHPTEHVNFIAYRQSRNPEADPSANRIVCCMEYSSYDPARGAAVTSGPAPSPLTGILLEYDEQSDELMAVGTTSDDVFNRFLSQFEMQLELSYGSLSKARAPVKDYAVVMPLDEYTKNDMPC
jgi:Rieske Fe-S protein